MPNLTTLAAVKAYLSIATATQDALIASFIARESQQVQNYTSRTFPTVTRTLQALNGTGSSTLALPDTPVVEVTALEINGVAVHVSTDGVTYGYQNDESFLYLVGAKFPAGRRNVTCSWRAGYEAEEAGTIPTGNTPTITPTTGGTAITSLSVTDSGGIVYAKVAGGPTANQYSFANGVYTFNASQNGVAVTLAYAYVPPPVEQAVIEMVSQDLKGRDNVGVKSRSIAGEVVSYSSGAMSVSTKQMLYPYRKLVPA